jgi:N-acyl homoserine lactone hydrolase
VRIHAIQTGQVRIKQAQVAGRGYGLRRQLAIFTDADWTGWLPTFAWAIEHPEGVIVVDTGQGGHLLRNRESWHPYLRWEVEFRLEPEEDIGPQLRALGIGPRDVRRVVLTHLHVDHDGGIGHFPHSAIAVSRAEFARAKGLAGRLRGYLPNAWPSWFDPTALDLADGPFGPFASSSRLTRAGDVVAVATPGHTAGHISVIVQDGAGSVFLAGDASYTEALMQAGQIDGVSSNDALSHRTLDQIRTYLSITPSVYLPTHDPDSARRLGQAEITPSAA